MEVFLNQGSELARVDLSKIICWWCVKSQGKGSEILPFLQVKLALLIVQAPQGKGSEGQMVLAHAGGARYRRGTTPKLGSHLLWSCWDLLLLLSEKDLIFTRNVNRSLRKRR